MERSAQGAGPNLIRTLQMYRPPQPGGALFRGLAGGQNVGQGGCSQCWLGDPREEDCGWQQQVQKATADAAQGQMGGGAMGLLPLSAEMCAQRPFTPRATAPEQTAQPSSQTQLLLQL